MKGEAVGEGEVTQKGGVGRRMEISGFSCREVKKDVGRTAEKQRRGGEGKEGTERGGAKRPLWAWPAARGELRGRRRSHLSELVRSVPHGSFFFSPPLHTPGTKSRKGGL